MTNRQTDKIGGNTNGQERKIYKTDRQTDRQTNKQAEIQIDKTE